MLFDYDAHYVIINAVIQFVFICMCNIFNNEKTDTKLVRKHTQGSKKLKVKKGIYLNSVYFIGSVYFIVTVLFLFFFKKGPVS